MPGDTTNEMTMSEVKMNKYNAGNPRNYDFANVPGVELSRTRFYRPSSHMTTMGCDYLYPLFWDEILPGDTFRLDVNTFARMTTALAPFMSNVYFDWQFFFVPSRLVWTNWQKFCGEQDNPGDSINFTYPYLHCSNRATPTTLLSGVEAKSIYDYLGIPPLKKFADHDVQALPMRCYNLIWNQWYRDENLQQSVDVQTGDGPDYIDDYVLLKRGKRKDYFTSALPSPQKGPEVYIPLVEEGSTMPVRGNGLTLGLENNIGQYGLTSNSSNLGIKSGMYGMDLGSTSTAGVASTNQSLGVTTDSTMSGLEAVFQGVAPVTINQLRQAFQMQKFFERLNRGGTRYIEILKGMFGVTSPDARLQRPELLTSFTVPLQLYQSVQTSASSEGSTPQGNLAANGSFVGMNFAFNKSFVEHGYVLGLASIRTDLQYQQGLSRKWSRSTRYDIYWPTFAHLGEQAIKNKEIYLQDSDVVDSDGNVVNDKAFGYQERWAEYKYGENIISGELRSSYPQSLDLWHLAQEFDSLPQLSSEFVESETPIDRVISIASDSVSPFIVDCAFKAVCIRPLPLFDVPGLVDHF